MPEASKYTLDYRPASYWTAPGDEVGEGRSVRRRPFFDLGRDFLPPRDAEEVEVALISLASVTGDVIAITARRWRNRIAYRIVDEYETCFRFTPKTSTEPLSMGELVSLIDGAHGHLDGAIGLTGAYRAYNAAFCDPEKLVDFVIVTSAFYPELQRTTQKRRWTGCER